MVGRAGKLIMNASGTLPHRCHSEGGPPARPKNLSFENEERFFTSLRCVQNDMAGKLTQNRAFFMLLKDFFDATPKLTTCFPKKSFTDKELA
jgi:hypothetical protein